MFKYCYVFKRIETKNRSLKIIDDQFKNSPYNCIHINVLKNNVYFSSTIFL